jgi:hypothetical protein
MACSLTHIYASSSVDGQASFSVVASRQPKNLRALHGSTWISKLSKCYENGPMMNIYIFCTQHGKIFFHPGCQSVYSSVTSRRIDSSLIWHFIGNGSSHASPCPFDPVSSLFSLARLGFGSYVYQNNYCSNIYGPRLVA